MKLFNEWMSIRQMNEPMTAPGTYQFSGTYELEKLNGLVEESEKLDIVEARKLVPAQYENQFGGMQDLIAGKALTQDEKEIVWICNESGVVFVFEKV
jgi:hypothetical protein